jgi:AraC-like DNA-binding protein/quercetin dioxygenase-like cupin family protein
MNVYRDQIPLNPDYPFQINEVILRAEDNCIDSFHWHSYFEITWIREGSGCYYVNGKVYFVSPGDLIIFNNVEPHGWQVLQDELKVVAMIFSPSFVSEYSDFSHMEYLQPFIERGSNFRNKVDRESEIASEIIGILREILQEWERQEVGHRLMIRADVLRILTLLIRCYQDDSKSQELLHEKKKAMKRLQGAFDYIDSHYAEKITLEETARMVYMSPNYFSSYFHKATETSFSDYVTMQRIRKANELLGTTEKSINEIAMECGFPNISNFYRLYKKHTGTSPRNRT